MTSSTSALVNQITRIKMPRKGSSSISAQDLLKLLDSDCKNGFIRQKGLTKIRKSIKWSHRFVILAHNALYVYENEMSKTPHISIPLLGYVAVERDTTTTCAWVFSLVPGVDSLSRKTFACANEVDRKDWMYNIKQHLYAANNVKKGALSPELKEKLKLAKNLTPEERDYVELEMPITSLNETDNTNLSDKHHGLDFDDSEDEGDIDDDEDDADNDDGQLSSSTKSFAAGSSFKRRLAREPKGVTVSSPDMDMPDGTMPPRYSAVVEGNERIYVNYATSKTVKEVGYEKACTITEESTVRDRDKCIQLLMKAEKVGTYLIRKSRTGDYKVLSILTESKDGGEEGEKAVREYKIEESYGLYHLSHDTSCEFPSLESMLAYYSTHKPLPKHNLFLGWGVHEYLEKEGEELYAEAD